MIGWVVALLLIGFLLFLGLVWTAQVWDTPDSNDDPQPVEPGVGELRDLREVPLLNAKPKRPRPFQKKEKKVEKETREPSLRKS